MEKHGLRTRLLLGFLLLWSGLGEGSRSMCQIGVGILITFNHFITSLDPYHILLWPLRNKATPSVVLCKDNSPARIHSVCWGSRKKNKKVLRGFLSGGGHEVRGCNRQHVGRFTAFFSINGILLIPPGLKRQGNRVVPITKSERESCVLGKIWGLLNTATSVSSSSHLLSERKGACWCNMHRSRTQEIS